MKHNDVIKGIDRIQKVNEWYAANCDGSGPHGCLDSDHVETKVYPIGGNGNLILCWKCFAKENRYNYERGKETGTPENFPQVNYYNAERYTYMEG